MKKAGYMILMILGIGLSIFLCGCFQKEKVDLTLWGSEESQEMLREIADAFVDANKKHADITIHLGVESELTIAEDIINRPTYAADVFIFADDQMSRLLGADILLPITQEKEDVISENGGEAVGALEACMHEGNLYAYPYMASNGYFMYYNAEYLSEKDVQSMDAILLATAHAKKKFSMDWSSGWYIYSFFAGAGLDLSISEDQTHNICNWNATDTMYTGVDVAKAMLAISAKTGFLNTDDGGFKQGIQNGTIIAGINGAWNAEFVENCWGENYRAVKLPTYTIKGEQVQMGSLMGYKLVGINRNTKNPKWAMKLARFLSNEDNQTKRFEVTGECPANVKAAQSEAVGASAAIHALAEQAPYANRQRIAGNFWTPATLLGTILSSGNPDDLDLQTVLDTMVENAQKPER